MAVTFSTEECQFIQNTLVDFKNNTPNLSPTERTYIDDLLAKLATDQPTESV